MSDHLPGPPQPPGPPAPPGPPGPPQQPTHHTAPAPGPVPGGPSKGLLIGLIAGVVGLLLIGLLVILLVVLGGGGSGPDAAVKRFVEAQVELDCEELVKHDIIDYADADECQSDVDEQIEAFEAQDVDVDTIEVTDLEVTIDEESDDEAVVTASVTITYLEDGEEESDDEEWTYVVTKNDDGDWTVSDYDYSDTAD